MKIELLAAGQRPPSWIADGFAEYQRRLPRDCALSLTEIAIAKRTKNSTRAQCLKEEEDRFTAKLTQGAQVVALDRTGRGWSTEDLAARLQRWMEEFSQVQLMIGGPDGLSDGCLAASNERWSLSALTFPHFLVRVLVAEQLYRAWSFNNNHPYHK